MHKPPSTAFATLPTPDCSGSRLVGSLPAATSDFKKPIRFSAIFSEMSSMGATGFVLSGTSENTIAAIFSGGHGI